MKKNIHVEAHDATHAFSHKVDFENRIWQRLNGFVSLLQVGQSAPETQHDSQSLPLFLLMLHVAVTIVSCRDHPISS